MNRQMKRAQERQERQQKASLADRRQAAASSARRAGGSTGPRERHKKAGALQFLKEVRQELKKVDWPTRKELGTYTVVVLATVIFMTTLVFGMDLVFSKTVLNILGS